ncbi:PIGA1 [Auxenochlorella protothecoides x Auxenochlorella symbiontica]
MDRPKLSILMVSDFFYPNTGGVENHIYQLSQCLLSRGHHVVVLTHSRGTPPGTRYLTNGLKVIYLPRRPFVLENTLPTFFGLYPALHRILATERVGVLHAHQAFSTMAHEAVMAARCAGCATVFTDHSLFGFADLGSIALNKAMKHSLADVSAAICVSHTSKENTVLRACLPPSLVSVIPNAVDAALYTPDLGQRQPGRITVVALSRMVYRKGIDLLAGILPRFLARHPKVDFIIGGDGPKLPGLRRAVSEAGLGPRVEFLGHVKPEAVRSVLVRGHLFLNCSLTEAFCMAIVEAAAAGLLVVSTRVGGVPEVLPSDILLLAEPSCDGILEALETALVTLPTIDPWRQHQAVREMYSWRSVTQRTEDNYYRAVQHPDRGGGMLGTLRRCRQCGVWYGLICCAIRALGFLLWTILDLLQPPSRVCCSPRFPNALREGLAC